LVHLGFGILPSGFWNSGFWDSGLWAAACLELILPTSAFGGVGKLSDRVSRPYTLYVANDQDEPRAPLARSPAEAGGVTAVLVGSGAWFGSILIVRGFINTSG